VTGTDATSKSHCQFARDWLSRNDSQSTLLGFTKFWFTKFSSASVDERSSLFNQELGGGFVPSDDDVKFDDR